MAGIGVMTAGFGSLVTALSVCFATRVVFSEGNELEFSIFSTGLVLFDGLMTRVSDVLSFLTISAEPEGEAEDTSPLGRLGRVLALVLISAILATLADVYLWHRPDSSWYPCRQPLQLPYLSKLMH